MDSVQKIRYKIVGYERLLKIIENKTEKDNIYRLKKKEINRL